MCNRIYTFESSHGCTAVALSFDLEERIDEWNSLRRRMLTSLPQEFSRDEWAYLITYLDKENLRLPFAHAFGDYVSTAIRPPNMLARPRGQVAVWLPNNVSLLGPLILILLSLTGNPLRLKGGSKSDDLTGVFLGFVRQHLSECALKSYLVADVNHEIFEQGDPRQEEMSATSQVRIIFGSEKAAQTINSLPNPVESVGFSFIDRRSEAWLEGAALDEDLLINLIKVFAIYGQAGCTSPRRVVLLNGSDTEANKLRDSLVEIWPKVIKTTPAMHIASQNIMAKQWASALGWDARLVHHNSAVLITGDRTTLPEIDAPMALTILAKEINDAIADLPPNIQTIGYGFTNINDRHWLEILAKTHAKRLVPIGKMHHFSATWDGQSFWRNAFEEVEVLR